MGVGSNKVNIVKALLKMRFLRDSRVSPVLESSCMFYTLRFCARGFLALTKKSLFLEVLLAPDDFKLPLPGERG
jgi:hypothetical protein